jgi:hypothetical protein
MCADTQHAFGGARWKNHLVTAMTAAAGLAASDGSAYAWSRTMGTEKIVQTAGPSSPYKWTSPATGTAGPNEPLQGAIDITYTAGRNDQIGIDAVGSYTIQENLIYLDENTFPRTNTKIAFSTFPLSITAATQTFTFVPPSFVTTLAPRGATTDFRIDAYNGWSSNDKSGLVTLTKLKAAGAPTGGAAGALPTSSIPNNTYAANIKAEDAPVPFGRTVAIYTFDSPNGTQVNINGFNNSGYSLVNASTNQLVYNGLDNPLVPSVSFDPSASFTSLDPDGTPGIAQVTGLDPTFAIQAFGRSVALASFFTTALPFTLPSDGGSVDISASSLSAGSRALWLDFAGQTPGSEVGFLIVGQAVPEPSTWVMLLLGFAGLGYAGYRRASARAVSAHAAGTTTGLARRVLRLSL